MSSRPTSLSILFDLLDRDAYPPQRAQLHHERYAGKELSFADTTAVMQQLNCTLSELQTMCITRPLLQRVDLDWTKLFMSKELKAFAFRLFAVGFKHAAMAMFCSGKLPAGVVVKVMSPVADEVSTLSKGNVQSGKAAVPLANLFGEGDLRCFGTALREAASSKAPVVVHSIDTDFLLMAVCTSVWLPVVPEMFIVLTADVYLASKLHAQFKPLTVEDKLNTAFWAMAFGTDYSKPLTNNGFKSADIKTLMDPQVHARQPITVLDDTTAVFSMKQALRTLKRFRISKKTGPDSVETTLLKMMFCLEYYGLMFVGNGLFPPTPRLHEATLKYTFTYNPNHDALFA